MRIQQARQAYDQLWHHYNQGLRASLYPFERDVAIAIKAIPERGIEETQKILCRSPQTQALLQTGDRDRWSGYIVQVVSAAQEKQLLPEQRDQGRFAIKVIEQLLNQKQTAQFEGQYYLAHYDAGQKTLTLSAKDGRGEILRQQGQFLVKVNLNEQDVERFIQTNAALQQRHRENQNFSGQTQPQTKSKQIEMD